MHYLLMIADVEADQPQPGDPRYEQYLQRWVSLFEEYKDKGMVLRGGGKLDASTTAKTVRVRGGKVVVSDGPFAETKEVGVRHR